MGLITYDYTKWPLFMATQAKVKHGGVVVDVGAGIRPQTIIAADKTIFIEPHGEYADALEAGGLDVIRETAEKGILSLPLVDTIVALDVIEHMEKSDGLRFIEAAKSKSNQIVIFTPLGFMPQHGGTDKDPWGMQGQHWQAHRSGWLPSEFEGWWTIADHNFHKRPRFGAFFAVWWRT
jgi:hypothetical protein